MGSDAEESRRHYCAVSGTADMQYRPHGDFGTPESEPDGRREIPVAEVGGEKLASAAVADDDDDDDAAAAGVACLSRMRDEFFSPSFPFPWQRSASILLHQ